MTWGVMLFSCKRYVFRDVESKEQFAYYCADDSDALDVARKQCGERPVQVYCGERLVRQTNQGGEPPLDASQAA
jgi:hypothetical protein